MFASSISNSTIWHKIHEAITKFTTLTAHCHVPIDSHISVRQPPEKAHEREIVMQMWKLHLKNPDHLAICCSIILPSHTRLAMHFISLHINKYISSFQVLGTSLRQTRVQWCKETPEKEPSSSFYCMYIAWQQWLLYLKRESIRYSNSFEHVYYDSVRRANFQLCCWRFSRQAPSDLIFLLPGLKIEEQN